MCACLCMGTGAGEAIFVQMGAEKFQEMCVRVREGLGVHLFWVLMCVARPHTLIFCKRLVFQ